MKTTYLKRKLTTLRNFRTTYLAATLALAIFGFTPGLRAQSIFNTGDFVISDNASKVLLIDGSSGMPKPQSPLIHPVLSAITGGLAFDHMTPANLLFGLPMGSPPSGDIGTVGKFNSDGTVTPPGTFGTGYDAMPNSMVLDRDANVYVGQQVNNLTDDLLKFNSTGTLIAQYPAMGDAMGAKWIDLTCDQTTVYYTSGSRAIKAFNTSTNMQIVPDFVPNSSTATYPDPITGAPVPYIGPLGTLRIVPTGVMDPSWVGQVIVAGGPADGLLRFKNNGVNPATIEARYQRSEPTALAGVSFSPIDGLVWTVDIILGELVGFDIGSGIETAQHGGVGAQGAEALAIKGELLCGNPLPPPVSLSGRMTGGGRFLIAGGGLASHGFTLRNPSDNPNYLTVTWKDSSGNNHKFKLTQLLTAVLSDNPAFSPNPPRAGFDTYTGTGSGELDGMAGATASWTFTDKGEPGANNDTVMMTIKNAAGATVLTTPTTVPLISGNHQAHP